MKTTLALAALTGRDVVILDGARYYSIEGSIRFGARGLVNLFEYDPNLGGPLGAYKLKRHNDYETHILPGDQNLVGEGDVWFLSEEPKRFGLPVLIASNLEVKLITVAQFFERFTQDTLVFDNHVILHARGKEGGGRGKTERAASVEFTRVLEGGIDASFITVTSANADYDVLQSGERIIRKPYMQKFHHVAAPLWVAGRNWIFSEESEAYAWSEAGFIGTMPLPPVEIPDDIEDYLQEQVRFMADAHNAQYAREAAERIRTILKGEM